MSRRPTAPLSAEDIALWHTVTRDVRRLRPDPPKPPAAGSDQSPQAPVPEGGETAPPDRATAMDRVIAAKGSAPDPSRTVNRERLLVAGDTPGVDRRQSDRVRKGRARIEARIDLHGLGQDEAHARLIDFIARSQAAGRRMVLVITGKGRFTRDNASSWRGEVSVGRGLLQTMVPKWLNYPPIRERIIGFHTAQPRDGGTGAYYVMLKRPGR